MTFGSNFLLFYASDQTIFLQIGKNSFSIFWMVNGIRVRPILCHKMFVTWTWHELMYFSSAIEYKRRGKKVQEIKCVKQKAKCRGVASMPYIY